MDISRYRSDIKNIIVELGNIQYTDTSKAVEKCDTLIEYGEKQRDDALIGFAHFSKGEIYYYLNDIPMFYFEMLNCLKPFEKIREWGYLAAAYNMLGIVALNRGNAPLAMDYYLKAYNYCVDYKIPSLLCTVYLNIGYLYLSIGNAEEALLHFDKTLAQLEKNKNMDAYYEVLGATVIGRGKVFLYQENMEEAWACKNEFETNLKDKLSNKEKLAFDCFVAKLAHSAQDGIVSMEYIKAACGEMAEEYPVMDIFDDVYDLLSMLLEIKKYDLFKEVFDKVYHYTELSSVKFLKKKLVFLKLRLLKATNNTNEYNTLLEEYLDLSEQMDSENSLMINSMLSLRNDYQALVEKNKEEVKKSYRLKRQSETDPLTGMSNRLKLNEYAEVSFKRAATNGVGFAIELLDIDYFKEYNDNYGHQAGDECLLYIAKNILSLSKNNQTVFCYRYGGDEFVVIYEGYTEQEVFDLAKKLKNDILDGGLEHEYSKDDIKQVTISQGLYWGIPQATDNIWEYLYEADQLLYKVKEKSRNSIMLGKAKHDGSKATGKAASRPLITELKDEDSYLAPED